MSTRQRLLLVSLNFAPELTGIGKYSGEMAAGLVARGHEVRVLCAPPYYPQWSVPKDYAGRGFHTEHPSPGLTVVRCPTWIPRQPKGLKRLLHLASFALSSAVMLARHLAWRPDAVMVVAPALPSAPMAWLAARLCGAHAWLHLQDLEVDAAFEMGLLQGSVSRRLALGLERWLLRRFDTVSTISQRMLQAVHAKGVDTPRTQMLRNWVDSSLFDGAEAATACRVRLGICPETKVCLYAGTLNRKQGLQVLIDAARALRDRDDILFMICGNGELRASLEQDARGLPNVRFLDLQPAEDLPGLLSMADIHLLPQLRCAADLVMPSKLGGMLASGRPVVAGAMPGTEIAAVVAGKGLVVQAEAADEFVQAIAQLADDPALRARLGAAGREYARAVLDAGPVLDALSAQLRQPVARSRRSGGVSGPAVIGTGPARGGTALAVEPVSDLARDVAKNHPA